MKIESGNITVQKIKESYEASENGHLWKVDSRVRPHFIKEGISYYFEDATSIKEEYYPHKTGPGILTTYEGFEGCDISFATLVWIEECSQEVNFEWIPLKEEMIEEVVWPNAFECKEKEGYSILPYLQGVLLPNVYDYHYETLAFDGQFNSAAAYLSCFGQMERKHGYLMIHMTPWDSKYKVIHERDVTGTGIYLRHLPSLGKMRYRRRMKYLFETGMDYNAMAKRYRAYVKETGLYKSLKEKEVRLPNIKKLIGSSVVHCGIKTFVREDSDFFDQENPDKNNYVVHFHQRMVQMQRLKEMGAGKLYLHLDGWAEPGYDNCHPDYLPACKEAGGWEGLKELADFMKENDDLFGLHDQYRDYYFSAPSHHLENAQMSCDGSYYEHSRWAGGRQNYLCTTLAKDYVKRNFEEIFAHEIPLTASYLDVFTCNELDECDNPHHRMSRKECAEYREDCFRYLVSKNILPSSEECGDWAMRTLVFSHYGPYEFMMKEENASRMGLPIPFFNLVYHDCFILPWPMEKGKEDYMLYALLNGGIPYLVRNGAYANVDGSFGDDGLLMEERIARSKVVCDLHETLAYEEMMEHHFLNETGTLQETIFSNGTKVTIDTETGSYHIEKA